MPAIKPLSAIEAKWNRRTSSASPEYEEGVKNPSADWEQATSASESSYEKGLAASLASKRFGKGVKAAGTIKWQTNALAKGVRRFSEGVALAQAEFGRGFAPFREVIARVQLPPRGPKGDPNNIQRVSILAKALHDAKVAQTK